MIFKASLKKLGKGCQVYREERELPGERRTRIKAEKQGQLRCLRNHQTSNWLEGSGLADMRLKSYANYTEEFGLMGFNLGRGHTGLVFTFHLQCPCSYYFSSSLFISFPLGQPWQIMSSAHWNVPSETRWPLSSG